MLITWFKLKCWLMFPVAISYYLDKCTYTANLPSVSKAFCCHMVQSSFVATCLSVNLYKCGLDPRGRDSLACTLAVDQQAFLCTPGGSVSTGSFRTGARLDPHCQDKFRKVTQDTHRTGKAKMPRYSQLFNPDIFT